MRKNLSIIILILIVLISCQTDKPKSSFNKTNDTIDIIELINDLKQDDNCKYSISKNEENFAIACPINDSIERKAWKWKINLYKRNGELIGTSDSEDLYDEIFLPLGNDSTLLVIFPVGTSTYLRIKYYCLKQDKFQLTNKLKLESNIYLFDHDYNGNNICFGISNPSNNKNNLINYCNSKGNVIWSKQFTEEYPYDLKISKFNNYIFLAIKSFDNKSDLGLVLDNKGDKLIDFELPDNRIGNFQICTSNDNDEKDLVIYSSNFIVHLDNNATNIKTSYVALKSNIYFEKCSIDQDGGVKMTGYKYERDSIGKRILTDTIDYEF